MWVPCENVNKPKWTIKDILFYHRLAVSTAFVFWPLKMEDEVGVCRLVSLSFLGSDDKERSKVGKSGTFWEKRTHCSARPWLACMCPWISLATSLMLTCCFPFCLCLISKSESSGHQEAGRQEVSCEEVASSVYFWRTSVSQSPRIPAAEPGSDPQPNQVPLFPLSFNTSMVIFHSNTVRASYTDIIMVITDPTE